MNKSEELAKMLNIEPRVIWHGYFKKEYGGLHKWRENQIETLKSWEEIKPKLEIDKVDYCVFHPDFITPSNFIMLLKIYGSVCTYIKMMISETGNELEEDLISDIIEVMSSHKKQLKILQNKAQEMDWIY